MNSCFDVIDLIKYLASWIVCVFMMVGCGHPYQQWEGDERVQEYCSQNNIDRRTHFFDVHLEDHGKRVLAEGYIDEALSIPEFINYLKSPPNDFFVIDSLRHKTVLEEAIVSVSVCNVRAEPRHSAELVTQHWMGYPLRIYERKDNWLLSKGPDNYIGWIEEKELCIPDSAWYTVEPMMLVQTEAVATTLGGEVITDMVMGNIVGRLSYDSQNTRILLPDGRKGYVPTNTLEAIAKMEDSLYARDIDVIEVARQLMGRPYLWGGTSSKGMDCSGFTRSAYAAKGVLLERDASMQCHQGKEIDTGENFEHLLPGDLLFFGRLNTDGNPKVTHVAIHMENGRFIHSSGRVQIESLNPKHQDYSAYRADQYLFARRLELTKDEAVRSIFEVVGR